MGLNIFSKIGAFTRQPYGKKVATTMCWSHLILWPDGSFNTSLVQTIQAMKVQKHTAQLFSILLIGRRGSHK